MSTPRPRSTEAGFTLIEALIAIVVLSFGLMAVTNLLVVATASNEIGNHSNATATHASEVMERLKAVPFGTLTAGGDVEAKTMGSISNCNDLSQNCVIGGNFNAMRTLPGIGSVDTFWEITAVDAQTLHVRVRSETRSQLAGRRARAEFTTFRSCTSTTIGCP